MDEIIQNIIDNSSGADLLDQLIEECAELIQACTKIKRAEKALTPVSMDRARASFTEEMADVFVTQTMAQYGIMTAEEIARMHTIIGAKMKRWEQRLKHDEGGA